MSATSTSSPASLVVVVTNHLGRHCFGQAGPGRWPQSASYHLTIPAYEIQLNSTSDSDETAIAAFETAYAAEPRYRAGGAKVAVVFLCRRLDPILVPHSFGASRRVVAAGERDGGEGREAGTKREGHVTSSAMEQRRLSCPDQQNNEDGRSALLGARPVFCHVGDGAQWLGRMRK